MGKPTKIKDIKEPSKEKEIKELPIKGEFEGEKKHTNIIPMKRANK